ncbi:hypothetical protein AK812_SmicGene20890 [Symbiodinium microadriaticum]|uniref:Uncharacterized protein n=1 Tax=Symbiodinium microadriaticum TaxID=2951 RepID=A0A1Q9DNS3_SYMMI|nr:hypothetical protein AK812_SmicGene20890 [Symbiodinium microadriaticum]
MGTEPSKKCLQEAWPLALVRIAAVLALGTLPVAGEQPLSQLWANKAPTAQELGRRASHELKALLQSKGLHCDSCEKVQLVQRVLESWDEEVLEASSPDGKLRLTKGPLMDEALSLLRQLALNLQASTVEVQRQGQLSEEKRRALARSIGPLHARGQCWLFNLLRLPGDLGEPAARKRVAVIMLTEFEVVFDAEGDPDIVFSNPQGGDERLTALEKAMKELTATVQTLVPRAPPPVAATRPKTKLKAAVKKADADGPGSVPAEFGWLLDPRVADLFLYRVKEVLALVTASLLRAKSHPLSPVTLQESRPLEPAASSLGGGVPYQCSLDFVDQVCLGCLLKGRSSSSASNLRLHSAVPGLFLTGVQPYTAFVASEAMAELLIAQGLDLPSLQGLTELASSFDSRGFSLPPHGFDSFSDLTFGAIAQDLSDLALQELLLRAVNCEGKSGNNRIQLAEAFPKRVCRNLAEAIWLSASEPAGGVSSVVRDSSDRIGEAANPGPPSRRKPRQSTLSNVELVEPATAKMRINIWDVFRRWVGEKLSQATLVKLFRCPPPGTPKSRKKAAKVQHVNLDEINRLSAKDAFTQLAKVGKSIRNPTPSQTNLLTRYTTDIFIKNLKMSHKRQLKRKPEDGGHELADDDDDVDGADVHIPDIDKVWREFSTKLSKGDVQTDDQGQIVYEALRLSS